MNLNRCANISASIKAIRGKFSVFSSLPVHIVSVSVIEMSDCQRKKYTNRNCLRERPDGIPSKQRL